MGGGGVYTYNLNEFHRSFSYFYLNFQMVQNYFFLNYALFTNVLHRHEETIFKIYHFFLRIQPVCALFERWYNISKILCK